MTEFKRFLKADIADAIGYRRPTAVQRGAMRHIMNGNDVFNQALSGSGRTLATIICTLQMLDTSVSDVSVLVLCNDMKGVYERYKHVSRYMNNVKILGVGMSPISAEKRVFYEDPPHIVIGVPEKIETYVLEEKFSMRHVQQLVIHSAHQLLRKKVKRDIIYGLFDQTIGGTQVIIDSTAIDEELKVHIKPIVNKDRLKIITDTDHKEEAQRGSEIAMPIFTPRSVPRKKPDMRSELKEAVEFKAFTALQCEVMLAISKKMDVIFSGRHASGKTTALVLAVLNKIKPLPFKIHVLALSADTTKNHAIYSRYGSKVPYAKCAHFGLRALSHDERIFGTGSWPIVVVTPERAAALLIANIMELKHLQTLIIHECDILFDKKRSPQTYEALEKIFGFLPKGCEAQVIMESVKTTLQPDVLASCKKHLKMKNLFSTIKDLKGTVLEEQTKPPTSSPTSQTSSQEKKEGQDSKPTTEEPKTETGGSSSKSGSETTEKKDATKSDGTPNVTPIPAKKEPESSTDKTAATKDESNKQSEGKTDTKDKTDTKPTSSDASKSQSDITVKKAEESDSKASSSKTSLKPASQNFSGFQPTGTYKLPDLSVTGFGAWLHADLVRATPFIKPRQVQTKLIPQIVKGMSSIHQSEMGSGKTSAVILGSLHLATQSSENKLSIISLCTEGVNSIAAMYRRFTRFLGYKILTIHPMSFEERSKINVDDFRVLVGHPIQVAELLKAQTHQPKNVLCLNMHRCFTLVTEEKSDLVQAVSCITKNVPVKQVLIESPTVSVYLLKLYKKLFPLEKFNVSSIDPSIMQYAKKMEAAERRIEAEGASKRPASEDNMTGVADPKRARQENEDDKIFPESQEEQEEEADKDERHGNDAKSEEQESAVDAGDSFQNESMETEEPPEEIGDPWDLGAEWRDNLAEALAEFKRPSEVQRELVPLIMEGYDVLCQSPPGQFTTSGIVLGIVQQLSRSSPEATVLFLCTGIDELREVSETFSSFADYASNVGVTMVGMNSFEFERRELLGNGVRPVVLGTPGILLKLAQSGCLYLKNTMHVVIHNCDVFLESPDICQQIYDLFSMTHPERQVVLEASLSLSQIRPLCRSFMSGGILTSQWLVLDKKRKARITVSEPLEDVMACFETEEQS